MLKTWLEELFISLGAVQESADELAIVALMVLIVIGAYLVYWILRNYLLKAIH